MATQKKEQQENLEEYLPWEIKTRGSRLLKLQKLVDCRFRVGTEDNQEIICGHKVMLSMASPVFEAMFCGDLHLPDESKAIEIPDVYPEAFRGMLEYIYTATLNITSFEYACGLYYAAKKYMLPVFVQLCTDYFRSNLCVANACRTYEFGKLFDEPELMEISLSIISKKTKEVFDHSSFIDVELSTLCVIFNQNLLNIASEQDLLVALETVVFGRGCFGKKTTDELKYIEPKREESKNEEADKELPKSCYLNVPCVEFDPKNRDHIIIREALKKIRFLTFTPKNFPNIVGSSTLLSNDEKLSLLYNIGNCSISNNCPLPEGFSTCRDSRNPDLDCPKEYRINACYNKNGQKQDCYSYHGWKHICYSKHEVERKSRYS